MEWYAKPEGGAQQLRVAPRLAAWEKADDPAQVRLRDYLDDTEDLVRKSRIDGPWTLRLDVGLPASQELLYNGDLDNYGYPLAWRLQDAGLVSVWCTKRHDERSFVGIHAAHKANPPAAGLLIARPTASASSVAYKEQIRATVANSAELPPGPVKLELSFVVGPTRNWLNLWKQTIDSLDPLLGRTDPDRPWNPRDGRVTELGMHVKVDPDIGYGVEIGIAASDQRASAERKFAWRTAGLFVTKYELPEGAPTGWGIRLPQWDNEMPLSTAQAVWLRDALDYVLDERRLNQPTPRPKPMFD